MEFLIELIIEVFGELILTLIANAIGAFVVAVDGDQKLKRTLKMIFTYSILILTILLITLSLIHSKKVLVIVAVSYMLLVLLLRIIKRSNDDKIQSKLISILVSIFRRIVHYSYPVLLIIFGALYVKDAAALTTIIILSSIAIILWFSLDMYKLWKKYKWRI